MSAQKRRREISPAIRGVIAYARNIERAPLKVIQARTGVATTSITNNAHHSAKQAKIYSDSSIHAHNSVAGTRSGRPPLLCQEEIDRMTQLATSSYAYRRKSWVAVAREARVKASRKTIEKAFQEAGLGRYSPRSKPNLTLEIREKRYS